MKTLRVPENSKRWADWVFCLDEVLGFHEQVVYTGHTVSKREDDWLLVIRARRGGSHLVCFIGGQTVFDCYNALAGMVRRKQVTWRHDRWADK